MPSLHFEELGGRHSSLVLSAPTILRPGFKSPKHTICTFSIFNDEIGTVFDVGMRKGQH